MVLVEEFVLIVVGVVVEIADMVLVDNINIPQKN